MSRSPFSSSSSLSADAGELSSVVIDDGGGVEFFRGNLVSDFVRFKRGVVGGDGGELQAAIVSYRMRHEPSVRVDLVSAIHIADKQFFEILQRRLESYDCVLYELLKNRRPLSWYERFDFIQFFQRWLARVLSLDFQLNCLDYEHENWQNADLDYETFKLLQDKRGENLYALIKKTVQHTQSLRQSSSPHSRKKISKPLRDSPMVRDYSTSRRSGDHRVCSSSGTYTSGYSERDALINLDIRAAMKISLAKFLTSGTTWSTSSIEEDSVLIGERNRVAAEVLRKVIDNGNRRIALLYGGGHMPDLGRRLREDFDMVPYQVQWVTAWSIGKRDGVFFPFLKKLAKYLGRHLNSRQTLSCAASVFFGAIVGTAVHFAYSAAYMK